MARIDELRKQLVGNVVCSDDIDQTLEKYDFYPVEVEDEEEHDIFKYTNKKSQIWVYYSHDGEDYLIEKVVNSNKKRGKTEVDPFFNPEDIKKMMDYFSEREMWTEYTIFMLELLLARRIGDTISLKWSDFYDENGARKDRLNTLLEQKTDKIVDISISNIVWKYLDLYCDKMDIKPMEHYEEDIFPRVAKTYAPNKEEYEKAVASQADAFRNAFKKAADYCGIKNVSTHSLRKSFGYIAHTLQQFDPDNLVVLQSIFGHENVETTKRYIGVIREKARKTFDVVSQFIEDAANGVKTVIKNVPVIALRSNDLRDLLLEAVRMGQEGRTSMEDMSKLLDKAEEMRVS